MDVFRFHVPTKVVFGPGALGNLPSEFEENGWRSALIVTDPGVRAAGLLARVEEQLQTAQVDYEVYDGVVSNPTVASIEAAVEPARGRDVLLALGGGSALDTAKVVNVLRTHGGGALDWEGHDTVPGPCGPLIAIPTTAGTGSEVTSVAMVTVPERRQKVPLVSRHLTPDVALVDPELTLSLPPTVTAATGMDALTHAIEALTSLIAQPLADLLAQEAVRRIDRSLLRAVRDGEDLEARTEMSFAALLAGMAFGNAWVGLAHAIAHALGGLYDIPHGVGCALALPSAMEFNLDVRREKYQQIAACMDLDEAEEAIKRVRRLRREIGLPGSLRDLGISEDDAETIAEQALQDGSVLFNPRPVSEEEMLERVRRLFSED